MRTPEQRVERWSGPSPMETGAPEPVLVAEGGVLWVAYRARDPQFPGWDAPDAAEYLESHPNELFGVLRFAGVQRHMFGPPSDERLREHPLYGQGLSFYSFHLVGDPSTEPRHWIVTFHDETLEVWAGGADAFSARGAASALESIAKAKYAVEHGVAPDDRSPSAPTRG